MITTNLEPILEQETGGADYRVGQPVCFKCDFEMRNPYLITDGLFNKELWTWMYRLGGYHTWYHESELRPFHKIRGEMKQLIKRVG